MIFYYYKLWIDVFSSNLFWSLRHELAHNVMIDIGKYDLTIIYTVSILGFFAAFIVNYLCGLGLSFLLSKISKSANLYEVYSNRYINFQSIIQRHMTLLCILSCFLTVITVSLGFARLNFFRCAIITCVCKILVYCSAYLMSAIQ